MERDLAELLMNKTQLQSKSSFSVYIHTPVRFDNL